MEPSELAKVKFCVALGIDYHEAMICSEQMTLLQAGFAWDATAEVAETFVACRRRIESLGVGEELLNGS